MARRIEGADQGVEIVTLAAVIARLDRRSIFLLLTDHRVSPLRGGPMMTDETS
jgi:hypothetical protein